MSLLAEIEEALTAIRNKLFNREDVLASEVEPIIEKVKTAAVADVKADAPGVEADAEKLGSDVVTDVKDTAQDVAHAVDPSVPAAGDPSVPATAPETPAAPSA